MSKRKHRKGVAERPRNIAQNQSLRMGALLDIIILVHRRFDLVGQCLDALPVAAGGIKYNIIIWDNGSQQDEADTFYGSRKETNLKVLRNKLNIGFPKGCNLAFRQGVSPLVFFLNDDVILQPDSIPKLVKELDDPQIGVVGMKLVFPEYTDLPQSNIMRPAGKLQHIGLASNIHGDFIHMFIGWSPDHPKVNAMRDVYAVTGAALMTRREIFKKAGMFYEGYGMGTWEDVDFCLTVREMGYNVIVVSEAIGIHHTGATAQTYKIPYALQENKLVFMQRWAKKLDWTEMWHV